MENAGTGIKNVEAVAQNQSSFVSNSEVDKIIKVAKNIEPVMLAHHKETELSSIKTALKQLAINRVALLVCGEFKRGKSSFINAFLGENICPTDPGIATSVISVIRYGAKRRVVRFYGDIKNLQQEEISFNDIERFAKGSAIEVDNTVMLIIELPSERLRNGLELIDTPGVGGLDQRHLFLTLWALPKSDMTFFVVDANEPLSSTELDFYRDKILPYSQDSTIILNKSDLKSTEDLETLREDIERKVTTYCDVTSVRIVPVSSLHWNMYNSRKNDKFRLSSNCDEVTKVLSGAIQRYKQKITDKVKDLLIDSIGNIENILLYQVNQINDEGDEDQELFREKLEELKAMRESLSNPSSELRKQISRTIKTTQNDVVNELSRQSILFSSECLDTLLKRPEAKEDNGGNWVLQQINLGLESLAAEVDLKIEAGFGVVNELLGQEIEFTPTQFTNRISVDLTSEKTFADKACNMARSALPGVGIGSLGYAGLGWLFGPVGAVIGVAAGALFALKSGTDANAQNRVFEMKSKLSPQITIAMNELKSYVYQRFDEFNDALLTSLQDMSNDIMTDMQEIAEVLKGVEGDKKEAEKLLAQLTKQLQFLDFQKKLLCPDTENPFANA